MARAKQVVWRGGPADNHPGKAEGIAFALECSAMAKVKVMPSAPLFNQTCDVKSVETAHIFFRQDTRNGHVLLTTQQ